MEIPVLALLFALVGTALLLIALLFPRVLPQLPRNRRADGRLEVNRTEAGVLGAAGLIAAAWAGPWLQVPWSTLVGALALVMLAAAGVHLFLRHGNEPVQAAAAAQARGAASRKPDPRARKRRQRH